MCVDNSYFTFIVTSSGNGNSNGIDQLADVFDTLYNNSDGTLNLGSNSINWNISGDFDFAVNASYPGCVPLNNIRVHNNLSSTYNLNYRKQIISEI